mmetsp:Transcript_29027/g.40434  ORF Transcript_29027/g.40434 Transcript_29027/m.40434 type:complete len:200 (+) Transcript_29027:2036-2635(+)
MIHHDSVSGVSQNSFLILPGHQTLVFPNLRVCSLMHGLQERLEAIDVVIGIFVLHDGYHTLKPHARIHVLGGKRFELSASFTVVLDENQVPDLDDVRVVHVDELARVAAPNSVIMELRARAAGSDVTHLPEVVLRPEWKDAGSGEELKPEVSCFEVRFQSHLLVSAKVRCVHSIWVESIDICQKFVCPLNSLFFEIISE